MSEERPEVGHGSVSRQEAPFRISASENRVQMTGRHSLRLILVAALAVASTQGARPAPPLLLAHVLCPRVARRLGCQPQPVAPADSSSFVQRHEPACAAGAWARTRCSSRP